MKKRLLFLILPIVTLILEFLPYGAVCNFANPTADSIEYFRELYSYFDLTPFGYANFAPLITGIVTWLAFVLVAIYCLTGNSKWASRAKTTLLICTIISLCPLLYGIQFFSLVGALISAALLGECLLLHFYLKKVF